MIDKKQLIEDLLECVNDATDTQTAMTGMTMCAILMNEVIDQALILPVVSHQRELLIDFCTKLELKAKQYSYLIPDEDFIDEYLKDN